MPRRPSPPSRLPLTGLLCLLLAGCAGLQSESPTAAGTDAAPPGQAAGQQRPQTLETQVSQAVSLDYMLYLPEGYDPDASARWPLLLYLHGAGARGSNVHMVTGNGPPKRIAHEGQSLPFIVVSPQAPAGSWWSSRFSLAALDALLDDVAASHRVDADRVYVTGLSMGGFGTFALAKAFPDRFAAIAPICGGGDTKAAASFAATPAWIFHGAQDDMVPVSRSEAMASALRDAGGDVRLTVYPDAGHDSWTRTYENPALYEWLLSHRRQPGRALAATREQH